MESRAGAAYGVSATKLVSVNPTADVLAPIITLAGVASGQTSTSGFTPMATDNVDVTY